MKGFFAAPNPVFFHSGGLVVYCSAVAAWFSTGIICHPIKNRTALVHAEWESVSLLCSSKDAEDKREETDRQMWRKREHLRITGLCNKKRQKRRKCRLKTDAQQGGQEKK